MKGFLWTIAVGLGIASWTPVGALEGSLAIGEATGRPGEVVEVPVIVTIELPVAFFSIHFEFDGERLEFLGVDRTDTDAQDLDPLGVSSPTYGPGAGAYLVVSPVHVDETPRIPAGVDRVIGKLRFRIDAAAPAGAAAVAPVWKPSGQPSETVLFYDGGTPVGLTILQAGKVSVLDPVGPRPVGDLVCEQALDRVAVSFVPTASYDRIEIARGGTVITSLPGDTTEFTDELTSIGSITYTVTAFQDGESSVAASCEVLAVSPSAPPVEDLTCSEAGLAWRNPLPYDAIHVLRDGEEIAILSGEAVDYSDPGRRDELTVYTVVGELEGFRSPDVHCLDHGVWIMEIGDVRAPVDATRVSVPVFVTTCIPVMGMDCCLDTDMSRLAVVLDRDLSLRDTVKGSELEYFAVGSNCPGEGGPTAGLIWDLPMPTEPEKNLMVGLRQHVLNFVFEPMGEMSPGDTFEISFLRGSFVDRGLAVAPDVLISGKIRFGDAGALAVESLKARTVREGEGGGGAKGSSSDVLLKWRSSQATDAFEVERNGALIAEIPGASTEYLDQDVPAGVYTYKIVAVTKGERSFPASVFLSTVTPPGAFLRGDSNRDGAVNVGDPIATLRFLFLSGDPLPCEDAADADDDGRLSITDPILTLRHLFLGGAVLPTPGTRYAWFDPTTDGLSCRE